jgi:2-phosphoglycerate kinase
MKPPSPDGTLPRSTTSAEPGIRVGSHGDEMPFSRGLLSQSLLATAMDANQAFGIARDIEVALVTSGVQHIDRSDLRALVHRMIRDRVGDELAARYLLWRRYSDSDRPVVLLLAGTSGVGKTSLSLEVARRLGIGRVQSTDSIRQIMRLLVPEDLVPAIHVSSYEAYKRLPRGAHAPPTVIDGFRAQAAAISIGVRASIERTIAESANLVIDGVSIVPDLLDRDIDPASAEVVVLLVATLDEESLRNRFHARAVSQGRRVPHRYIDHLDGILEIQRHLLEISKQCDVPVIDNVSFDRSVQAIIAHVMSRLQDSEARRAAS